MCLVDSFPHFSTSSTKVGGYAKFKPPHFSNSYGGVMGSWCKQESHDTSGTSLSRRLFTVQLTKNNILIKTETLYSGQVSEMCHFAMTQTKATDHINKQKRVLHCLLSSVCV